MTESDAKNALRAWVLERGNPPAEGFTDASPLVREGIINSLDVLELLTHIEALRGGPVDRGALSGAEFESVDAMAAAFFGAGS